MISAMSSTKHQPILGKRPHGAVEAEFPLRTISSIVAAKEFAEKSQNALLSVNQNATFPGNTFVFLPLITPNQLQRRFQVAEDDSVYVVITKSYPLLKKEVESLNFRKYCGIYVKGPIGIGKSYLLYLLASEYRLYRRKNRVTYINDCTAWRRLPYHYLLKELVATFYDDTIEGKSIVDWCQAVTQTKTKEELMTTMMLALIDYIKQKDLCWLVIFDQHNALYSSFEVEKLFPFNLIGVLADHCSLNIKVVVSASANNEGYPIEMDGWLTHEVVSHRFDDDEFKMWCDHYQLEHIGKVKHDSEEALDALFWTGGVPYELNLLWKQPTVTLVGKTMLYRENREGEMAQSHVRFCENMSIKRERNLEECVSRMALGLPPPNSRVGMDQQLFDVIPDTTSEGKFLLTALNPVARQALITHHGQGLLTSLGLVVELVFDGLYSMDVKGRFLETYILTMLEISRRFYFLFRQTTRRGLLTVPPVSKKLDIKCIIRFSGNKLPMPNSFKNQLPTLFIPTSSNYPGFDFFIWNSVEESLMAFQVTIKNPFTTHSKIDGARQIRKLWLDFCFAELVQKPMEIYWIIPRSCLGTPINFNDQVILLEDLHDNFPALKKLNLNMRNEAV